MGYIKDTDDKYSYDLMNVVHTLSMGTNPQYVKIKDGKGKSPDLPYVSGDYVIGMLNKLFLYQWSFTVKNSFVQESHNKYDGQKEAPVAQVLGSLEIPGLGIREQFGSQVFLGGAGVQESAFKSAATDALKKCAASFGIAIDLYSGTGKNNTGAVITVPTDFLTEQEKEILWQQSKGIFSEDEIVSGEVVSDKEHMSDKESVPVEVNSSEEEAIDVYPQQLPPDEKETIDLIAEDIPDSELISDTFTGSAMIPENQVVPEVIPEASPEPATISAKEVPPANNRFLKEDILALKDAKTRLGIQANSELDIHLINFFENNDATFRWIDNSNIKNVVIYLNKIQL